MPVPRTHRSSALGAALVLIAAAAAPAPAAAQAAADTVTTASGLKYYRLVRGDGPRPRDGDVVRVHGIGSFPSGEVFWNSREDRRPFEYVIGSGRAIRGFVEAMELMQVGDRAVFIMPPELAYGDRERGNIPPGATLVFDYEVLGIGPAAEEGEPPPPAFPGLADIRRSQLRADLEVLAGDGFRGRETTTPDELKAAAWAAERAREAGLEPAGEDGTWFQWYELRGARPGLATRIRLDGTALEPGRDAVVMSPAEADLEGDVLWVGSGTVADTARHDARGRVVAVEARGGEAPSEAVLASRYYVLRTVRNAARPWLERGATAVIVVADEDLEPLFERAAAYAARGRVALEEGQPLDLGAERSPPTILVRRAFGERLRRGARIAAALRVDHYRYPSLNVIARVPGSDPTLRGQHVLFSSHIDHDGVRAAVRGDSIMNGADDNASTSVALLAIGRAFARNPARRSALFVWHGAEDRGLNGSKWHATHPVVPLDSIVAVLNGDMIGRNHADSAALLGVVPPHRGSVALVDAVLDANRRIARFAIDSTWDSPDHPEGWYFRSDHVHYAQRGVPALFFTSLLHDDYHTPFDGPERIDYDKLARMTRWMYATGWTVANADARPKRDPGFRLERTR